MPTPLKSGQVTSGGVAAGQVLTADGSGGAQWDAGGGGAVDAADVTYTPAVLADWDGAADPGDADNAFDQLAERVTDIETAGAPVDASVVTYTPAVNADWDGSADPGNADDAFDQLAERVTDVEGSMITTTGDGHITILPFSYSAIGAGSWIEYRTESSYYDWYIYTVGNLNNISYKIFLGAGTYTFLLYHVTNTNGGIIDVDIAGVEVGSIDQYAALAYNVRSTITGIVISTGGVKELKLRVDGKNGSSSDYAAWIEYIALWRTA